MSIVSVKFKKDGKSYYFCSQWYEHSNSRQKVAEFVSKYQGVTQ